jgi:methyl-accepting chemotaxis protein
MTQQNAALVEQSAAAAEALRSQAGELVQAVSVFKLADSAQPPQAAPAWSGAERRGPDRAKNITRPAFGQKKKPAAEKVEAAALAAAAVAEPAKTGSDDWTSF